MARCGSHRSARLLFFCLLAFGLGGLVVMLGPSTLRVVRSNVNTTRFLVHRVSALREAAPDPVGDAGNRSLLVPQLVPAVRTGTPSLNVTSRPWQTPAPDAPLTPFPQSSGGHRTNSTVHPNSSSSRPSSAVARFPPRNSSALEVTVAESGMLGNHMFQYASLLGVAHMNGRRPFCRSSTALDRFFEVTHVQDRSDKGFEVVGENNFAAYHSGFEHLPNKNVVLMQYLQSWKYFHSIRDTIQQEFTFKQHIKDHAANLLTKFAAQIGGKTKVGVHVRRGDLTLTSSRNKGYHTAPVSYLFKAMDFMRQKHGDVIFIVVSDDPGWCSNNLKTASDYVMPDRAPGEVHLALLASCDHVIMTVGTYGWWGGYLSGGDVVYYWDPKECLHQPPKPVEITHPEDFFLPHWVPLTG